jgi:beta-glucanase (GH16 family)
MKFTVHFFTITLFFGGQLSYGVEVKNNKPERVNSAAPETVVYPAANLNADSYSPGEGWNLAWSDEFEGDVLNEADWNRQIVPAGRFNEEWQAYTESEENAWVEDGYLVIQALHKSAEHGHAQYTSARLNTAGKQAWKYGKIAARIQLPYGEGIWPAFWMLGANCNENGGDTPWPQCGEIDIMEMYGSKSDAAVEANIHSADADGEHQQMGAVAFHLDSGNFFERFHVFEIEWDEQRIRWKVDGREYAGADISIVDDSEFHQPHFILLNLAVGGTHAGRPDESTLFPQTMYVDWVRVYQR